MDKELASALQQLMFEPFAFLSSNLGLYVENLYASHIVRTFIEIYSSVRVPDAVLKSRVKADFKPGEIFSCKIRAVSTWLCYCLWFFTARLYAGNLAALPCTCTYMYKWSLCWPINVDGYLYILILRAHVGVGVIYGCSTGRTHASFAATQSSQLLCKF